MAKESSRTTEEAVEKRPGFREIADRLRADIKSGTYGPGAKLPTAVEIATASGTGKTVVYRAFATLQAEGLVDVRPGDRAYVRNWTPILRDANERLSGQRRDDGLSIWAADMGKRKWGVETTASTTTEVPTVVRELLDVSNYLVRRRVFTVDGERVQLGTSYLDAEVTDGTAIEEVDPGSGGTFGRLKELGRGPVSFREDIRTRTPSAEEVEALQIGANRQVYEIVRKNATADGDVVEVTHMVLVADAYVLRYHVTS